MDHELERKVDALSASVDQRFDAVDAAIREQREYTEFAYVRLDAKIDARLKIVDARFDTVDARFDKMDIRFDKMDARFDKMDIRFDKMDARFDKTDSRFDRLERKLDQFIDLHLPPRRDRAD